MSKQILVIDDDVTSLDIVSYLFEEKGYTVCRCVNGYQAIEAARVEAPALIVVDLLMPEINGVETVREIRDSGLVSVPIIAFTAVDDPTLHGSAIKAGCDVVLTKPCPADKLLKSIERYLPGREEISR